MFIDSLRSGSALRQEGHVDVAKALLPTPREQSFDVESPYCGTDMALLAEGEKHYTRRSYKHVPPYGGPAVQPSSPWNSHSEGFKSHCRVSISQKSGEPSPPFNDLGSARSS